jgi:enamine deaminase RidA (YjgF/YER057c/UK114 family)
VFVSGQTPRDLDRRVVAGPFRRQTEQVYANLRAVAEAGGSTMSDALGSRST